MARPTKKRGRASLVEMTRTLPEDRFTLSDVDREDLSLAERRKDNVEALG